MTAPPSCEHRTQRHAIPGCEGAYCAVRRRLKLTGVTTHDFEPGPKVAEPYAEGWPRRVARWLRRRYIG